MKIVDMLLEEIEAESKSTRRVLAAVPEDRWDWKPHEKSMTLGHLAGHMAEAPGWVTSIIGHDDFDFGGSGYEPYTATDKKQLLAKFDHTLDACRETLRGAGDDELEGTWTARMGDRVVMKMSRLAAIKNTVFNHIIHHRGQMTVYLRLLDVPVPSTYGPTADAPDF